MFVKLIFACMAINYGSHTIPRCFCWLCIGLKDLTVFWSDPSLAIQNSSIVGEFTDAFTSKTWATPRRMGTPKQSDMM